MGQFLVSSCHLSPVGVMTQMEAPWPHPLSPVGLLQRALPLEDQGLFILVSNQTLTSSWQRLS